MDKSKDSLHLFDTVVLILKQMNEDVEKYIEVSVSEGLKVEVSDASDVIENRVNSAYAGLLVITDDDEAALQYEKRGVAVVGYRAPGHEYDGFSTKYVVEELPMVDDEYFNLVYMRAHHIPVEIAETSRTIIREMTEEDLSAMYELYADPIVAQWTEPLYEYEEELEFTRAYIDNMYTFYGYGLWLVFDRSTSELIGRAGISRRVIDDKECCELGYIIKGSYQRQGIGYEVSCAIIKYAVDVLGIDELWLCTEEENKASIALADKLGFKLWGSDVCDSGRGEEKGCYLYRKVL